MTNIQRILEKNLNTSLDEYLRIEYVEKEKTFEEIALTLGVSPSSIRLWIQQLEYHQKRKAWNKGLTKAEMREIIEMRKKNVPI